MAFVRGSVRPAPSIVRVAVDGSCHAGASYPCPCLSMVGAHIPLTHQLLRVVCI
ncbi:unnamed protein product [Penicillium roqueforti FM164]|uniref:Genomic scaffold, ProqFM164S04 n=1 Tax=Penicillium roqueforti (strain FM164) TaxID=1365484 RepID=W6QIW5_PENRF|nr:unnamed protein product [Penicillium roqueforti FM164]